MNLILALVLISLLSACTAPAMQQRLAAGKKISFQRSKGNCLACHVIEDGEDPGNIGPALVDIQAKFNSKEQLKAIIWDATQFNEHTIMPPFGRNKILNSEQLDLVVDYIWSLNTPTKP